MHACMHAWCGWVCACGLASAYFCALHLTHVAYALVCLLRDSRGLLCTGMVVFSEVGSFQCPAGYYPITDAATCKALSEFLFTSYRKTENESSQPKGCYAYHTYQTSSSEPVYFNSAARIDDYRDNWKSSKALCAVGTGRLECTRTHARTHARSHTCTLTHTCA